MNCPNCGEEIRTDLYDDTAGAVFASMDSDDCCVRVWPAMFGVKKYEGCVEFGQGNSDRPHSSSSADDSESISLSIKECKLFLLDCPKEDTAWFVKPHKDSYEWERVDEQIGFSIAE